MLGLPDFWTSVLAFYLISLSSVMMGLAVSAIAANSNTATSALPILLIPQFLMSGALVPVEDVQPEAVQYIFYFIVAKWGYELIGGGLYNINSLIAFDEPIKALDGSFEMHWWIIVGFAVTLYIISTLAMLRKDRDLS